MTRILAFVVSLLLLAGTVDPTRGWMIALAVLAGLGALRLRPWRMASSPLRLDMRLASFVLALVLLAGAVDPTRDWLVVMSVVSGLAAFMPRVFSLERELFGSPCERRSDHRGWRRSDAWEGDGWR